MCSHATPLAAAAEKCVRFRALEVRFMASPSDRAARLVEAQNQLSTLLVEHDEASRAGDWQRVATLRLEIDTARTRRDQLRAD
jgi:hypothetical protein